MVSNVNILEHVQGCQGFVKGTHDNLEYIVKSEQKITSALTYAFKDENIDKMFFLVFSKMENESVLLIKHPHDVDPATTVEIKVGDGNGKAFTQFKGKPVPVTQDYNTAVAGGNALVVSSRLMEQLNSLDSQGQYSVKISGSVDVN